MHNIKRISFDNKNIKEEENDQMCIGEWIQDVFRRRTAVCMRHFIQANDHKTKSSAETQNIKNKETEKVYKTILLKEQTEK